jgi:hypothetical protein
MLDSNIVGKSRDIESENRLLDRRIRSSFSRILLGAWTEITASAIVPRFT